MPQRHPFAASPGRCRRQRGMREEIRRHTGGEGGFRERAPCRCRSPRMLPSTIVTATMLDAAINRAQRHLLDHQQPDGHWVGEVEADVTITSEYLLFCHLMDRVQVNREARMVRYLRRRQLPDGG